MSRTIRPAVSKNDERWDMVDEAVDGPYIGLRWRDLETVCDTVEYLCVDADPLRESLRHESGETGGVPPRDFTLTREEIEQLHEFARNALAVVEEAYDIEAIFEQYVAAHIEESGAEPLSDEEYDRWKTRNKLRQLRNLTRVALERDLRLEVG